MGGLEANARRFTGFADLYDRVRPSPPDAVADLVLRYAGMDRATRVVDLGSGTGLSTRWCARFADSVVGIEPSDDMRRQAERGDPPTHVSYAPGWAHDTCQPDGAADVVVAAQALHWMDPSPTYAEVARILRPGGVFVALDCDWPPNTGSWQAEAAWIRCWAIVKYYEDRLGAGLSGEELRHPPPGGTPYDLPDHFSRDSHQDRTLPGGVHAWSKDAHLSRMKASGAFRWCTELAAEAVEDGDHVRFVDLFRSQGHLRQLLAAGLDEQLLGVHDLAAVAAEALGDGPVPFWFTYRVRLGVT